MCIRDSSGAANPLAVTMDANKSITGSFTRDLVPPEYRRLKINDAGQLEWVQVGRPGKTLTSDYSLDLLNWKQFTSDSSASGETRIPFNRPAGINNLFIRTWEEDTGYAARAIGYVTLTVPTGYSLIGNPLSNGGNRVSDIFPSAPSGSTLSKYNAMTGKWESNTFTEAWSQPGMTLAPGEGAVFNNKGEEFDVLLAGFTPWSETTLSIPQGKSVVSPRLAKGWRPPATSPTRRRQKSSSKAPSPAATSPPRRSDPLGQGLGQVNGREKCGRRIVRFPPGFILKGCR